VIDTRDSVFIVLDLVEGGELFDKVVKIGQYNEKTAKLLFYQMVLAIKVNLHIKLLFYVKNRLNFTSSKYLHDQGISHRDLKPENILLESSETNETLIKVTDFGLSKFFDSTIMMKTFCGTPNYLAPEVLTTRGEGVYTNKIDNWSLGVILYICLVGYPPFSDEDTKVSLETQIKKGLYTFPEEFWSGISSDAIDVIKKLLTIDPNKRASLEEVLEHKWIKEDKEMKAKADALMGEAMKKLNSAQYALKRELSNEQLNNPFESNQIMANKKVRAVDNVPAKRRAH
jgi:serine/threonine-protein kinase Chk2